MGSYISTLSGKLRYDSSSRAFSPYWSRVGVSTSAQPGIQALHLFYNRRKTTFAEPLIRPALDAAWSETTSPVAITKTAKAGGVSYKELTTFAGTDVVHYSLSAKGEADAPTFAISILAPDPALGRKARYDPANRLLRIDAPCPRTDGRDPDPYFEVTIFIALPEIEGEIRIGEEQAFDAGQDFALEYTGSPAITVRPAPAAGTPWQFVFGIALGDDDRDETAARVSTAALLTPAEANARCEAWLSTATAGVDLSGIREDLLLPYCRALDAVISNTIAPHGRFGTHRAMFPNRGVYSTHYLWDTCFTNLAVVEFDPELAKDGLRILAENQEEDGKIPHFVTATWNRPGEAQPPLIAWSAMHIYDKTGDLDLLRDLYDPLCRWHRWWRRFRDEDSDGLCEWGAIIESGWDDSPRGDKGKGENCDLNSYLIVQTDCLSRMAGLLGKPSEAAEWSTTRDELRTLVLRELYDDSVPAFFDRKYKTHEPIRVLTPACFLPLWAGVPIPEPDARRMIENVLLDPEKFYGQYPFPCVAYDEATFQPTGMWRGPIWPNIAHLMCEVLGRYGYEDERREAVRRLVAMVAQNGMPYERYNPLTGEGLGAPGLGWASAVFMMQAEEVSGWE